LMLQLVKLVSINMLAADFFINSAAAQVIIPHDDYDSDFEKYFVATVSLAVLIFAVWRYWRSRR
jgi:hypothetical protein